MRQRLRLLTSYRMDTNNIFQLGFSLIKDRLENRLYPSVSHFAMDVRSVLRSPPDDPRLDFDIRVKGYVPPHILYDSPAPSTEDGEVVGAQLLEKLESSFEDALTKEREIWTDMQERSAKRPRLLEQFSLDTIANGSLALHGPSVQLENEASPEQSKEKTLSIDPTQLAMGGTILGDVSKALAKELLSKSSDKKRPPWYVKDYRPSETEVDTEPTNFGGGKGKGKLPRPPFEDVANASTESVNAAEPENTENVNGTTQDSHVDGFVDEDCEMEDAPGEIEEDAPGEVEEDVPADVHEEDASAALLHEEDAPGEVYEEDAPGEVDDEFLPPPPKEPIPAPVIEPESLPRIHHSDLHDEDAEGEIDDELTEYTIGNDIPTLVSTPMNAFSLPEMDSAHEIGTDDDLLGGYRPEDLPSPLGTILESASSVCGSHNMAEISYPSRPPMTDYPDLPPNLGMPDTADVEQLDNTSVLSDYPEDLDKNRPIGANGNAEHDDEVNLAENELTPSRRNRKASRSSNGRFVGGRATASVRKKRR
jgi:hypothetical protein